MQPVSIQSTEIEQSQTETFTREIMQNYFAFELARGKFSMCVFKMLHVRFISRRFSHQKTRLDKRCDFNVLSQVKRIRWFDISIRPHCDKCLHLLVKSD